MRFVCRSPCSCARRLICNLYMVPVRNNTGVPTEPNGSDIRCSFFTAVHIANIRASCNTSVDILQQTCNNKPLSGWLIVKTNKSCHDKFQQVVTSLQMASCNQILISTHLLQLDEIDNFFSTCCNHKSR